MCRFKVLKLEHRRYSNAVALWNVFLLVTLQWLRCFFPPTCSLQQLASMATCSFVNFVLLSREAATYYRYGQAANQALKAQ